MVVIFYWILNTHLTLKLNHSMLVVGDIVDKNCVFIPCICFLGHNTLIAQHCNCIDLTEVVFLTNLIW